MRGKILGFDGSIGAILGEDGKRYTFVTAEWRGEASPTARETVDFVQEGASASQIYPLRGTDVGAAIGGAVQSRLAAAERALDGIEGGDLMARIRAGLANRPQVILTSALLVFTFGFTWMSFGAASMQRVDITLAGFADYAGTIRGPLSDTVATMEQYVEQASSTSYGGPALAIARTAHSRAATILTFLRLAPLLYLIPIGAAAALIFEYRRRRMRIVELATGAIALGSLAFALIGRAALAQAVANDFSPAESMVHNAISLGWGAWLIGLAGAGLILTALGLLKRTPGL